MKPKKTVTKKQITHTPVQVGNFVNSFNNFSGNGNANVLIVAQKPNKTTQNDLILEQETE